MRYFGPTSYNIDVNQLGASQYPRITIFQESPYKDAIVEDVILNETHPDYSPDGSNVGLIQVRFIPDDRGVSKENLNWASPLESSIREYPLKNELVIVFYSVGRLFYTRRLNVTNKITNNSWPALSSGLNTTVSTTNRSEAAVIASRGGDTYSPQSNQQISQLGSEFKDNPLAQMVRPNEGDLIIYGRFGNLIRFGSSLISNPQTAPQEPQPNILMTVGQTKVLETSTGQNAGVFSLIYEDINENKSAFWMVADQEVEFEAATQRSATRQKAHLRSSEITKTTPHYVGAQIFVNSDRVILNSKVNEISLFSKSEINLSAIKSVTVDTEKSVFLTANEDITVDASGDVFISGVNIALSAKNNLSYKTSGNYSILGKKIFIGTSNNPSEPMVLGASLSVFLQRLIDIFATQLPTATAVISTAPGVAPVQFTTLIAALKLLKETQLGTTPQSAVFNSADNFTTKNNSV